MDSETGRLLLDIGLIVVLVLVGVRLYRRRRRATPPAESAAARRQPATISNRADAEQAAAAHLAGLGFDDARPLPDGREADAIDVRGRTVDAHVRWHARPADIASVERLKTASRAPHVVLYCFAGIKRSALKRADEEGVAVFRLDPDGTAVPLNDGAKELAPPAGT